MALSPELVDRFAAAAEIIREPRAAAHLRVRRADRAARRALRSSRCPRSTAEVQAVVRICNEATIPFVARGAGTGLSGGALPVADGIVISLARMNRVLAIDVDAAEIVVEPGVTNLDVTRAVADDGFYYAPDPSSQQVCTIGGNVAENSGGAHCLKYGFTVNHVLAAEVVLPSGELRRALGLGRGAGSARCVRRLGGNARDRDQADAAHSARAGRRAHAARRVRAHGRRGRAPSRGRSRAGILPAAIEMMDAITIEAAEAAVGANYPRGLRRGPDRRARRARRAGRGGSRRRRARSAATHGATEIRVAADAADRAAVWRGRKAAFAAMGRVSPDYYVQDGVVPRTRLPEVLRRIDELSQEHGLRVGNVFHAGDGNLHPLVLYDGRIDGAGRARRGAARARSWRRASTRAARSPASTASAPTRRARCR